VKTDTGKLRGIGKQSRKSVESVSSGLSPVDFATCGILQDRVYKNQIKDTSERHEAERRGAVKWSASDWHCNQRSLHSARHCKPALQLAYDISHVHFEHHAHLLNCSWLTFQEEMMKSFVALTVYFEFQILQSIVATYSMWVKIFCHN